MLVRFVRRYGTSSAIAHGDALVHCAKVVRERDYALYMSGQAYSRDMRAAFYALRAFAIEMASVPEMVTNQQLGTMRYQFWRDALKQIYDDKPPQHPIALGLHYAARVAGRVPAYHLRRIVDARADDLARSSYMTTDELVALGEGTAAAQLYAQLAALGLGASSELAHAASHVGAAAALATLLRALPYHAAHRRMVLPVDLTAAHGVAHEDVFRRGGGAEGLADAVFALASVAHDHLRAARTELPPDGISPAAAPVLVAAAVPASLYLQRLEQANFDAFAPELQAREWKLAWRMWRALRTRQI